jgi:cytochrome c
MQAPALIEPPNEKYLMQPDKVAKAARQLIASAALCIFAVSATNTPVLAQSIPVKIGAPKGDPSRGETLYQGCMDCHSIDKNDVGPSHRGVVGRHAGIIEGYDYSKALKNSGLTWDEPTLDRWLTDPGALVPGTKMFYEVQSQQDRADIIAYLKQQN